MAIKGDKVALYLSGQQVPVEDCNLIITQPTIKQIVAFGETDFLTASQLIGKIDKFIDSYKMGSEELSMLSNFQILLMILQEDESIKNSVVKFFEIILPGYDISLETGLINFKIDGKIMGQLNPMNFPSFQEEVVNLFSPKGVDKEIEYNPVNDKAKEIAAKLKRGREKVAEQKAAKSGNKNASLFGTYTSMLSIGMNMDINILYNYTPFQLFDALERYIKKDKYDTQKQAMMIPFADTSKMEEPEHWMDNLY
jgi:hypothetical protein